MTMLDQQLECFAGLNFGRRDIGYQTDLIEAVLGTRRLSSAT